MSSRRMVLWLSLLPLFAACTPAGVELSADIARSAGQVWVLEGSAFTVAELDGVPTWARFEGGEIVAVAPLPPEHGELVDVLPLGANDVVAVDAAGALLALGGEGWTVLGALDDGGPPLVSVCGRDVEGALWLLGSRSTHRPDEVDPWEHESRLVQLRGGSFESHPLPFERAECWMADGEVWATAVGGGSVWQRTDAGWIEHAPWSEAGLSGPTPRSIAGRTYLEAAEQLWSREGGEWIAHAYPATLPDGRSLEEAHAFYAAAPDDVVVALDVLVSTGCFYRWCGSELARVDLYRWDGVAWYGIGSLPPLADAEDSATRGLTHLWLDEDGAHAVMGGRVYFGSL